MQPAQRATKKFRNSEGIDDINFKEINSQLVLYRFDDSCKSICISVSPVRVDLRIGLGLWVAAGVSALGVRRLVRVRV